MSRPLLVTVYITAPSFVVSRPFNDLSKAFIHHILPVRCCFLPIPRTFCFWETSSGRSGRRSPLSSEVAWRECLVPRQPWEVRRVCASIFSMRTAIEREDELVDAMFNCGWKFAIREKSERYRTGLAGKISPAHRLELKLEGRFSSEPFES
jgi:hypothetical protein